MGERHRIRAVPGVPDDPFRLGPGDPLVLEGIDKCRPEPGHRRGRERSMWLHEPRRGIHAHHSVDDVVQAVPVGARELIGKCPNPVAPHEVELDEGAVLVEDRQLHAGERVPGPSRLRDPPAGGPAAHAPAASRSGPATGTDSRTRGPSAGNEIVMGSWSCGRTSVGSLKTSRVTTTPSAIRIRIRTMDPRKLTSATVPRRTLEPSGPVPRVTIPGRSARLMVSPARASTGREIRNSCPPTLRRPAPASTTAAGRTLSVPTNEATKPVVGKL